MNQFEKNPHLFANGKFKVRYSVFSDAMTFDSYWDGLIGSYDDVSSEIEWLHIEDCTLIARPIEDMTDEEMKVAKDKAGHDSVHFDWENQRQRARKYCKGVIYRATCGRLTKHIWEVVEYLFSIGVYPFDQSHFKTGEVININKI